MKCYEKPSVRIEEILSKNNISSLSDWLQNEGTEYGDVSIVTYALTS